MSKIDEDTEYKTPLKIKIEQLDEDENEEEYNPEITTTIMDYEPDTTTSRPLVRSPHAEKLNVLKIIPSALFFVLKGLKATIYAFRYRIDTIDNDNRPDIPHYITSFEDFSNLPSNAILKREPITDEDLLNIDIADPPIFFKAQLGSITYFGNTREGYWYEIRRPITNYQEALTHYSMGWELHDLWGDLEGLQHSDGNYIMLRKSVILRDFNPPHNCMEAFNILYSYFGDEVFIPPSKEDLTNFLIHEPKTAPDHEPAFIPDEIKFALTRKVKYLSKPPKSDIERFRKTIKDMPTAIYSVERHFVVWNAINLSFRYYADLGYAIDTMGIPIKAQEFASYNFPLLTYIVIDLASLYDEISKQYKALKLKISEKPKLKQRGEADNETRYRLYKLYKENDFWTAIARYISARETPEITKRILSADPRDLIKEAYKEPEPTFKEQFKYTRKPDVNIINLFTDSIVSDNEDEDNSQK